METYSLALMTKRIYDSGLRLFSLKALEDILAIKKKSTLFSVIGRLTKSKVLLKVEKGKYLLQNAKVNDFVLANFIYSPSYVSFESALNFYGLLSQFPYEVTSSTPRKTRQKVIDDKVFSYIHLKKDLFWGYEKKEDFLIAWPEKALLDQLYLASKGLKRLSLDEYDLSLVNRSKLRDFLDRYPKTKQFEKIANILRKEIRL